jgi:large subunit ribosomal protein L21e
MPKSRGYRYKTRKLLRKRIRERGLRPLGYLLYTYRVGEKVVINIDPSSHRGMPHRRYHGRVGIITGKRGRAYVVEVIIGKAKKNLFVRPEHLMRFKGCRES